MRKFSCILLFVMLNLFQHLNAQQNKIDSLLTLLKTDAADTNKVIHLYSICDKYNKIGEFEKGLIYGEQALELAKNLGFKKGEGSSYNNIGVTYWRKGNFPEALKNQYASLRIRETLNDKKGIANCYNNIGNAFLYQGNMPEALKNYATALKFYKEIKDKKGIAGSYGNMGVVYKEQGNNSEALRNYFAALNMFKEIEDKYSIAASYGNIGVIYENESNYPDALKMYLASLNIEKEIENKDGIASCYINLAALYNKRHATKEAESYINKGLLLSKEIGSKDYIKEAYAGLIILDSIMGNYKAAFEHHKLYIIYSDSLNNEETKKKSLQTSMQYEFDKREIAAKAEQDKLDAINKEEKQKQRVVIYAVAGLLVLAAVFAVFMFNRFRITNRQKVIIEKQKQRVDEAYNLLHERQKEIIDSITYAKRIQTALITSERYISNSLTRLIKS